MLLLVFFICCVFFYLKYRQQNDISLITTDKEDILNNKVAVIKNVDIKNVQEIKVSVCADKACKLEYAVKKEEIKEQEANTISIPIYYLVADKVSNININIKLKNNKSINKKIKTVVDVKNNTSIKYYDSIPDIIVKKISKENADVIYSIVFLVCKEKEHICAFFINFDIYGNIRSFICRSKEDTPSDLGEYIYDIEMAKMKIKSNVEIELEKSILKIYKKDIDDSDIFILEIDKNTNQIIKSLNLKKILGLNYDGDWLHPNSLVYDKKDDTIILSSRNLGEGSVIKIDRDGNVIYILADPKYFLNKETKHLEKYLLKPVIDNDNENFEWSYRQHSIICLSNENIVLFDNGCFPDTEIREMYSRAVIYKINEKNMTIEQVWQYGKELGKKFYSIAHGNVLFDYNNKSVLINSPFIILSHEEKQTVSNIREVNITTNELLFDVYIKAKNLYFKGKEDYYDYVLDINKVYV